MEYMYDLTDFLIQGYIYIQLFNFNFIDYQVDLRSEQELPNVVYL